MNLPRLVSLACLCVACGVGLRATDVGTPRAELLQADEAFCTLAAHDGVRAAFLAYAAPDCIFLDTQPFALRGSAAVTARFREWKDGKLTWKPAFAEVEPHGKLGYTWGTWLYEATSAGAETKRATGKYVTIWKRQPDGSWKYVLDTGVTDPLAAAVNAAPHQ
ncbi:DUF4440 domain-containing protein [Horticoccus luteus]|uniref:DUF4440 domain-containing protein n=1 Tax=Horticoccus luteus TaxID=2862869 RepID=A0A8F9XHL2_9BACT|nr:DUF4440 domain-containing protein [Horticoccus luteus]QYM79450.1 DUF4440 domain-containing protein [Horticoccus luteus]